MKGAGAVVGGVLVHLTLGNLYSYGNLVTYLGSYLRARVDSGVTYGVLVWVIAASTASQGLFMMLGGIMERALGPRVTCALGCAIMSGGVALTCLSVRHSVAAVVFTYGVMVGLGTAIAYASPLACAMKWFPERKGLINGLIVAGFGLGSLVSTSFQTFYLNPDNVSVDKTGFFTDDAVLGRVPGVFVAMALFFVTLQLIGCFLLCKPPEQWQAGRPAFLPLAKDEREVLIDECFDDEDEVDERETTNETNDVVAQQQGYLCSLSVSPSQMVRTPLFYHLWTLYCLNSVAVAAITATYKSFGQTFLTNDRLLSQVGALAALFNAGGRLFWGRLMDGTSFKTSMLCVTLSLSLLFAGLPLAPLVPAPAPVFTALVWGIFFSFSGTFVLMPTVVEKAFGPQYYAANYGLLFTNQVVSGAVVGGLSSLFLGDINYSACFLSVASLTTLCFLLTWLLPRKL